MLYLHHAITSDCNRNRQSGPIDMYLIRTGIIYWYQVYLLTVTADIYYTSLNRTVRVSSHLVLFLSLLLQLPVEDAVRFHRPHLGLLQEVSYVLGLPLLFLVSDRRGSSLGLSAAVHIR